MVEIRDRGRWRRAIEKPLDKGVSVHVDNRDCRLWKLDEARLLTYL